MDDLTFVGAHLWNHLGRRPVTRSTVETALCYELGWFKPSEAKTITDALLAHGLLQKEGEFLVGAKTLSAIVVPLGYHPPPQVAIEAAVKPRSPLLERILASVTDAGKPGTHSELSRETEEVAERLGVSLEGAALLVAWGRGVRKADLLTEFESSLSGQGPAR